MLHAKPDTGSDDGQHQAESASSGPEKEEAQHRKECRHRVQNDHHLPVREAQLKKLVVNVFAVGSKNRASADETAHDGERSFENRQPERNHRNGNRDLQLDVNLLTSHFPVALADAIDRVLAMPAVLPAALPNDLSSFAAHV